MYNTILTYNGIELTDYNVLKIYESGRMSDLEDYLVDWALNNPIPIDVMTNKELIDDLLSLQKSDSINSRCGLRTTHHFMGEKFLHCKGSDDDSIASAWKDPIRLRKAIRTRIGGLIETDKQSSNPIDCVFDITPQMLIQGIRSSRQGFYASNFKPALAKDIIQKYSTDNSVIDYSAGWGARMLAAISLNYNYYGIDPCTSNECNNMAQFYKSHKLGFKSLYSKEAFVINGVSEDSKSWDNIPSSSLAFSCPPYFNYEIYYNGKAHIDIPDNIEQWMNIYWIPTVKNIMNHLKPNGKMVVVISNELESYLTKGLNIIERIVLTNPISHLSKKTETGITTKQNEVIIVASF